MRQLNFFIFSGKTGSRIQGRRIECKMGSRDGTGEGGGGNFNNGSQLMSGDQSKAEKAGSKKA